MPSKVDWDTTMPTAGIPVPGKTPLV